MVVIFTQIRGQIKLGKLNTQFKVIDPNIHEILHTEQYYEPNHQNILLDIAPADILNLHTGLNHTTLHY